MCMGIPEGKVRSMGGSHIGKVVKIIYRKRYRLFNGTDFQFNFQIFSYFGSIKTSFISNSLTERARQIWTLF